jgi:hypothetical protein
MPAGGDSNDAAANAPHLQASGRGLSGGPVAKYTTAGKTASRFFLDCLDNDGNLPAGLDDKRKSDCGKVLSAYKAMMTPEEAKLLEPPRSMAVVAPLINSITGKLIARIKEQYRSISKKVPPRLGQGEVGVNSLTDNIRDSRLIISSQAFAAWRARGGQGGGQGSSTSQGDGGDGSDTEEEEQQQRPRKSPRKVGPPGQEAEEGSTPSGSDGEYEAGSADDEAMPVSALLAGLGSPGAPITFD